MAQFTVRNLEDDIHQKLRDMAQSRGQNLEEYVRELLRKVVLEGKATPNKLGTKIAKRFAKIGLNEDSPINKHRSTQQCYLQDHIYGNYPYSQKIYVINVTKLKSIFIK